MLRAATHLREHVPAASHSATFTHADMHAYTCRLMHMHTCTYAHEDARIDMQVYVV